MKILSNSENNDGQKDFSNNMVDACKTLCKLCQTPKTLHEMRSHTKKKHNINITAYKEKYGELKDQIMKKTFHRCGLCSFLLLLDSDEIAKHLKRSHKVSHKEYNDKFMQFRYTSGEASKSRGSNKIQYDEPNELKKRDFEKMSAAQLLQEIDKILGC